MAVKNLVSGVLAQSITTSTTNVLVNIAENVDASGIQSFFPTPPFYITIMPKSPTVGVANRLDSEILQVTAIGNDQSGNASLTCVRGQRDTTAKSFDAGSIVTVGVYADDAVFLGGEGSAVGNPAPWVESSDIKNGAITTDKIANGAVTSSKIDWTTLSGDEWPLINTTTSNKNINNKGDYAQFSFTVPANGRYFVSFTQQLGSNAANGYGLTLKIKLGDTTICQSGAAITGNAAYMYGVVSCVVSANVGKVITCTATGGSTNSASTTNGRVSLARVA